jgi:hypothetical protein
MAHSEALMALATATGCPPLPSAFIRADIRAVFNESRIEVDAIENFGNEKDRWNRIALPLNSEALHAADLHDDVMKIPE